MSDTPKEVTLSMEEYNKLLKDNARMTLLEESLGAANTKLTNLQGMYDELVGANKTLTETVEMHGKYFAMELESLLSSCDDPTKETINRLCQGKQGLDLITAAKETKAAITRTTSTEDKKLNSHADPPPKEKVKFDPNSPIDWNALKPQK